MDGTASVGRRASASHSSARAQDPPVPSFAPMLTYTPSVSGSRLQEWVWGGGEARRQPSLERGSRITWKPGNEAT
jgi:hypothetical protein